MGRACEHDHLYANAWYAAGKAMIAGVASSGWPDKGMPAAPSTLSKCSMLIINPAQSENSSQHVIDDADYRVKNFK